MYPMYQAKEAVEDILSAPDHQEGGFSDNEGKMTNGGFKGQHRKEARTQEIETKETAQAMAKGLTRVIKQ